MNGRNFRDLIEAKWDEKKFLCIGLDSELERIPQSVRKEDTRQTIVAFNRAIIDATKDVTCAYKPNAAFYEARGEEGAAALRETMAYITDVAPEMPVILDAKRGDIGHTNAQYARAAFDHLRADAVTVNPYAGADSFESFLAYKDKGVIVWCRTSNAGAGEFQDLLVDGEPLYKVVARNVAEKWNDNGNCGVVVGATFPEELKQVRDIVGDMPILIPGIGAQKGNLEKTIQAGKTKNGRGMIVSASRTIIFASDGPEFAERAKENAHKLHEAIKKVL